MWLTKEGRVRGGLVGYDHAMARSWARCGSSVCREQYGADLFIFLFVKAAPKLDGSNIGFKMLSAMGWEEGGRIGAVGGLEAPLVAVIKTTKSGLGANRG